MIQQEDRCRHTGIREISRLLVLAAQLALPRQVTPQAAIIRFSGQRMRPVLASELRLWATEIRQEMGV